MKMLTRTFLLIHWLFSCFIGNMVSANEAEGDTIYNLVSLEPIFKFNAYGFVLTRPSVVDGAVYFGASGEGSSPRRPRPHNFYALDSESGDLQWSFPSIGGVRSSAVVIGKYVIFGSRKNASLDDSGKGRVYALDRFKGSRIWSYRTKNSVIMPPLILDDSVFSGCTDGYVYSIDLTSGEENWVISVGGSIFADFEVFENILFVGNLGGRFVAVDAEKGEEVWSFESESKIDGKATVYGDDVLVSSGGTIYRFDAVTGAEIGTYRLGSEVYTNFTLVDDILYFGSDEIIYAFDLMTREIVWQFAAELRVTTPVVSKGLIYFGSADHHLYVVDEKTGTEVARYHAGHAILGEPTVSDGVVYFGASDGMRLYALQIVRGDAQAGPWKGSNAK